MMGFIPLPHIRPGLISAIIHPKCFAIVPAIVPKLNLIIFRELSSARICLTLKWSWVECTPVGGQGVGEGEGAMDPNAKIIVPTILVLCSDGSYRDNEKEER